MKKLTALILAFTMILFCAVPASAFWDYIGGLAEHMLSDTTWSIYLYLCGADLESRNGCATADLESILNAGFGDNIHVVVCTGGAKSWEMPGISAKSVDYYSVENSAMHRVKTNGNINMGDPSTLSNFIRFARSEYPADREMLIIWDHGGGVLGGVCYDENFGDDCLTIPEVKQALASSMTANMAEPPLEFICFDTCLTANLDMAAAVSGYARYMIGSEEVSLSGGTRYCEILQTMMINPGIESVNLGKFICETFALYESLFISSGTISMLDLQKLPPLLDAYEQFGREAQALASSGGNEFYVAFSRAASKSVRFGQIGGGGFYDMTDLGSLMTNASDLLPSAQHVLNALNDCVIYSKHGRSNTDATGLACYYPYSGSLEAHSDYRVGAYGTAVPTFYHQMLSSGSIFADAGRGSGDQGGLLSMLTDETEISLTDDTLHIHISQAMRLVLTGMDIQVYAIDQSSHRLLGYGRTHSITGNWETGDFSAKITDKWGALNNHLCHMEPVMENDDVSSYHVPVLLNGARHRLVVEYDYITRKYTVRGAFAENSGDTPSSNLVELKQGDRITTLLLTRNMDMEEIGYTEYETFTLGSSVIFADAVLPNGYYYVPFTVSDFLNGSFVAQGLVLELKNGKITYTEMTLDDFR